MNFDSAKKVISFEDHINISNHWIDQVTWGKKDQHVNNFLSKKSPSLFHQHVIKNFTLVAEETKYIFLQAAWNKIV